jgi:hypothetical protein
MSAQTERSALKAAYREASGATYLAEVNEAREAPLKAPLKEKWGYLARNRSLSVNYDWLYMIRVRK